MGGLKNLGRHQNGFSLIELMVGVVVIGVLVATALPAYQDYVNRSKVSEVMMAAHRIRQRVHEYHETSGQFTGVQTLCQSGFTASKYARTASVCDSTGQVILIGSIVSGNDFRIKFTPTTVNGAITAWNCTGNLNTDWLPSTCVATPNVTLPCF